MSKSPIGDVGSLLWSRRLAMLAVKELKQYDLLKFAVLADYQFFFLSNRDSFLQRSWPWEKVITCYYMLHLWEICSKLYHLFPRSWPLQTRIAYWRQKKLTISKGSEFELKWLHVPEHLLIFKWCSSRQIFLQHVQIMMLKYSIDVWIVLEHILYLCLCQSSCV